MSRLRLIAAVAALASVLGGLGVIRWQAGQIEALRLRLDAAEAQGRALRAETELLRTEIESDKSIDAIPDGDLGAVIPDRWRVRPPR